MVKGGITNWFTCARNSVTLKSLLTFCRLTCIINLAVIWPQTAADCTDIEMLKSDALECFRHYNTQKHNVDRSDQKLFSGINIEILRAYCSSYLEAMQCVSGLVSGCPASSRKEVEKALVSYNGIQDELTDLCTTQRLYELYSQHMGCFSNRGEKSEWCYKSKLNNTVHNIYTQPSEEFCSQVRDATSCIENNIQICGEQAKELVHLLVKPTISGSAHCKYNIVQEETPQTMKTVDSNGGNSQPKERATSSHSQNSHSSATNTSANFILILITLYMSYLAHWLKSRGLS